MKRKILVLICLIFSLLFSLSFTALAITDSITVNQTNAKVLVNGVATSFEAYIINGNNYFKLRDLAKVVSGTQKQFEVSWDEKVRAINLVSNSAYTPVGGELANGDGRSKQAIPNTSIIYKDGSIVQLTAYTINGNNYFKLRDVAQAFNIGITWDGATSTVGIDTAQVYIPEDKTSINASPLSTKVLVNGTEKPIEAYKINGKEYFKLGDLSLALKGTTKSFTATSFTEGDFTLIDTRVDYHTTAGTTLSGQLIKGDGTTKKASLITPKVYFNEHEIRSFTVYNINGNSYYQLDELMELLRCGVIRDEKANTINLATSKAYEPTFIPIPQGNVAYQVLQQKLYDAYFNAPAGSSNIISFDGQVTVPDNATLYVPDGVVLLSGGNNRIFLGNNSTFHVRGTWFVEYPDRILFPVSNQTKNAIYIDENPFASFEPMTVYTKLDGLTSGVRVRLDGNKWGWNETDIPFESASISYGESQYGVDKILLNFTRKKTDIKLDLKVVLYENTGVSHTIMYRNVRKNVDLMPELANIIAKNIGKNITISKIDVFNYYIGPHDIPENLVVLTPISIPLNWTITTSGVAPTISAPTELSLTDTENILRFTGLTNATYLAKYTYAAQSNMAKFTQYGIVTPGSNLTARHIRFGDIMQSELIVGDKTNIALLKGKKGAGIHSYSFNITPFSQDSMYFASFDYSSQATLTKDNEKWILNYKMVNLKGSPTQYNPRHLLIRAQVAGEANPRVIFQGEVKGDLFDITKYLTSKMEKLYIHGYYQNMDSYIPTIKYVEIPLTGMTISGVESVQLGSDTYVNINKTDASAPVAGTVTSTVTFYHEVIHRLSKIQISPTGKNTWTNILDAKSYEEQLDHGQSTIQSMTFNPSTLYDIKCTFSDFFPESFVITGVDFSSISASPGASIKLKYEMFSGKNVAIVSGNIASAPPKTGEFGTDTIDVILIAGERIKTFNLSDFSLVLNDGSTTKYPKTDIRIIGLSQTTPGNAKITIARDKIPQINLNTYFNELNLYYKGEKVGKITFNNWY